ncbi:hypothetical protein B0T17DRAFT_507891 [Bombardia bombarda]|uniref:Uncharacterized protein n=1 Tax=Bombardia bombarda TaxID=252184 RepID=A0AA39X062_9PEZI|nr:hypothetical protein B0T17DRAFT_507891 [Bombardia bombarda]
MSVGQQWRVRVLFYSRFAALRKGARVIIQDVCVPEGDEGGGGRYQERQKRSRDIAMLAMFNSKERTERERRELVTKADGRFRVVSVVQVAGSPMGVLEVCWDGE